LDALRGAKGSPDVWRPVLAEIPEPEAVAYANLTTEVFGYSVLLRLLGWWTNFAK
jgi:hypothetical protein